MSDRFEVGEVAIYNRPESAYHGIEVTVISNLQQRSFFDTVTGTKGNVAFGYEIEVPGLWSVGVYYFAEPHELRKRRPPQDWVKLCRLTERMDGVVA